MSTDEVVPELEAGEPARPWSPAALAAVELAAVVVVLSVVVVLALAGWRTLGSPSVPGWAWPLVAAAPAGALARVALDAPRALQAVSHWHRVARSRGPLHAVTALVGHRLGRS